MCDHNCGECKTPCALSKVAPKLDEILNKNENNKKEGNEKMALGSCNSGTDEKLGRLDERNNFIKERNSDIKISVVVAITISLISLFVGWTALRDMDALRRELYEFKIRTDNIILQADEAQRAYVNARKTLERARR